jgi:hypothetical protein
MRVNAKRTALAAVLLASVAVPFAWGAGLWSTLPVIGGSAYCASSIGTGPVQGGITGQGAGVAGAGVTTGTTICGQTVPAGPTAFAGTEFVPMDIYTPGTATQSGGPTTALVNINQLGQGPILDSTQTTAAVTIPAGTQFMYLDTGTPTTLTVTMPAGAIEGQEVHLFCFAAVSVSLTISGNTGQTVKGAPTTCAANSGFLFRFSAVAPPFNGASGVIVANQWVRIQ